MMTSVIKFFSLKTDVNVSKISNKQNSYNLNVIDRNRVRNVQIHGPKSVPKCQESGTLQDRYVLRRTFIFKGYKDYEFNYLDSLLLLTSSVISICRHKNFHYFNDSQLSYFNYYSRGKMVWAHFNHSI
jgi:hypothetical protein